VRSEISFFSYSFISGRRLKKSFLKKFSFKNLVRRSDSRFVRKRYFRSKKEFPVQGIFFWFRILFFWFRIPFLIRILFSDSTWDPDPGSDLHIVGALPGTQKSFKKWRNLVHVFILEQNLGSFSGPGESFLIQNPGTPPRTKKRIPDPASVQNSFFGSEFLFSFNSFFDSFPARLGRVQKVESGKTLSFEMVVLNEILLFTISAPKKRKGLFPNALYIIYYILYTRCLEINLFQLSEILCNQYF